MLIPPLQLVKRTDNILFETHGFLKTIEGATVLFSVKKNLNDTVTAFTSGVEVDFVTGSFTVPITSEDTDRAIGRYFYDIVATKDGKRYLVAAGELEIIATASSIQ